MNYIYILFLFQLPLSVCKKYRIKTNPGKINIIVEIGHNIIPKGVIKKCRIIRKRLQIWKLFIKKICY